MIKIDGPWSWHWRYKQLNIIQTNPSVGVTMGHVYQVPKVPKVPSHRHHRPLTKLYIKVAFLACHTTSICPFSALSDHPAGATVIGVHRSEAIAYLHRSPRSAGRCRLVESDMTNQYQAHLWHLMVTCGCCWLLEWSTVLMSWTGYRSFQNQPRCWQFLTLTGEPEPQLTSIRNGDHYLRGFTAKPPRTTGPLDCITSCWLQPPIGHSGSPSQVEMENTNPKPATKSEPAESAALLQSSEGEERLLFPQERASY